MHKLSAKIDNSTNKMVIKVNTTDFSVNLPSVAKDLSVVAVYVVGKDCNSKVNSDTVMLNPHTQETEPVPGKQWELKYPQSAEFTKSKDGKWELTKELTASDCPF